MQAQSNLEIIFRKIPNSNRQKPPINKRTIKTLPWALANRESTSATNHIKRASFRIIGSGPLARIIHLPGPGHVSQDGQGKWAYRSWRDRHAVQPNRRPAITKRVALPQKMTAASVAADAPAQPCRLAPAKLSNAIAMLAPNPASPAFAAALPGRDAESARHPTMARTAPRKNPAQNRS